jgi:hypothetical protein
MMRFRVLPVLVSVFLRAGVAQIPAAGQPPQDDPGRKSFESRCGRCHRGDGKGGETGPDITGRLSGFRTDAPLTALMHNGLPGSGMLPPLSRGRNSAIFSDFFTQSSYVLPRVGGFRRAERRIRGETASYRRRRAYRAPSERPERG